MIYVQPNQVLKTNTSTCEKKNVFMSLLENRFQTYGYKEVKTPMFEPYDLYSTVDGLIQQKDMIKVIDSTGKVLVLRPDATIPLARMMAQYTEDKLKTSRYFYMMDVFRQTESKTNNYNHMQAGIECFGNASPGIDAEVLALSKHVFQDIGFPDFTLEIGHAGFIEEVLSKLSFQEMEWKQLKTYLQAKNKNDLQTFLIDKEIDNSMKEILLAIPDLYGTPESIIPKVKELSLTNQMKKAVVHLETIYQQLELYDMADHIVINFGLLNQMTYYSDIIFQGFIKGVGKPVLMGGRYDTLTEQFGMEIPAIGFACDIDLILNMWENSCPKEKNKDVVIHYDDQMKSIKNAYRLANELRRANWNVLCEHENEETSIGNNTNYIVCIQDKFIFQNKNKREIFPAMQDILKKLTQSNEI